MNALLLATGATVVLMFVMARPLVGAYAGGFAAVPGKLELTVLLTRVVLPFLSMTAVAAAVSQCLEADGARKRVGAAAAVFFRHRHALNPDLRALAPRFAREGFGAIALDDVVIELCLGELDDAVAQRLLFVGKGKVHQRIALRLW